MDQQIFNTIRSEVERLTGIATINMESNAFEDLGMDSLDSIELIIELEKAFSISIPDEISEKMITIKDIYDYIYDVKTPAVITKDN